MVNIIGRFGIRAPDKYIAQNEQCGKEKGSGRRGKPEIPQRKITERLNILPRKAEHTAMSPRHPSLALERPLAYMSRLREIDG